MTDAAKSSSAPVATFYDEASFFDAWKRGVSLAGLTFFGDGRTAPDAATSKNDLAPDYDMVQSGLGQLSSGEAVFLAAMYSFYNATVGGKMLAKLKADGLGDISAALDEQRVRVLADLMISYPGW